MVVPARGYSVVSLYDRSRVGFMRGAALVVAKDPCAKGTICVLDSQTLKLGWYGTAFVEAVTR
jgi:hypothetical protein